MKGQQEIGAGIFILILVIAALLISNSDLTKKSDECQTNLSICQKDNANLRSEIGKLQEDLRQRDREIGELKANVTDMIRQRDTCNENLSACTQKLNFQVYLQFFIAGTVILSIIALFKALSDTPTTDWQKLIRYATIVISLGLIGYAIFSGAGIFSVNSVTIPLNTT